MAKNEKHFNIGEAETKEYYTMFGLFDERTGNYVDLEVSADHILQKNKSYNEEGKTETEKQLGETGNEKRKTEIEIQLDDILNTISDKDILKMSLTIKMNGQLEKYTTDNSEGFEVLTKEQQIKKIREVISSFKDLVIVHSKEELKELQDEYNKKHPKTASEKSDIDSVEWNGEGTNVLFRLSDQDHNDLTSALAEEQLKVISTKAKSRNGEVGFNVVVNKQDAQRVREIIAKLNKKVIKEVEGNVDWKELKYSKNKYENITKEGLENFQKLNKNKYKYVAFKNGADYTVFADEKCDITIGFSEERKSLNVIKKNVDNYREANSTEKNNVRINKSERENLK